MKSGIDEESHRDLTSTLLHRIGQQQLLEHVFDTIGTREYNLRVLTGEEYLMDLYVKRHGIHVKVSNLTTTPFESLCLPRFTDWRHQFL